MPMSETIHEPKHSEGFRWADDITDAAKACQQANRAPGRAKCPVCKRTVLLHCEDCRIQVTACICTMVARMEPIEAYKKLAEQVGQTQARAQFAALGYNMPVLPFLPL